MPVPSNDSQGIQAHHQESASPVQLEDLRTGEIIDIGRSEHEAFWSWAVIETLRHTGIRVEELVEITHLALVSYQLPDTGEKVPMLQILPSKANEERLLLVSPELASVLASIITRLRREHDGTVPLTARYDPHEHLTGPPLPHLFQHRHGPIWAVPNYNTIRTWLDQTIAYAGLIDAEGQPLRYTPHDFRRIFATDAASGGLPVHISARLLGHQQHFQLRKLELGECGRPYGTPCKHEHACIRCPSLRLASSARPRLVEIIANLRDRIQEAKLNGWLGEVAGLDASLQAAARKLASLDRMRDRQPGGPVNLGIPVIADSR